MATNANELRAAVVNCVQYAAIRDAVLRLVPADDAEPVTVEKLEAWGGESVSDSLPSQKHERRFMSIHGQSFRCVNRGGTWVVDVYVIGSGWRFATADRNTVGQMRQTLEGLGIKLKGGE